MRKAVNLEHSEEEDLIPQRKKAEVGGVYYLRCEYERLYLSEDIAWGSKELVEVILRLMMELEQ